MPPASPFCLRSPRASERGLRPRRVPRLSFHDIYISRLRMVLSHRTRHTHRKTSAHLETMVGCYTADAVSFRLDGGSV
eukprot:624069-Pyramimonas_sp.AAC.1